MASLKTVRHTPAYILTSALKSHLWQFYLDAEQPIEGPFITINKGTDAAKEAIYNLPADHPELKQMELGGNKNV